MATAVAPDPNQFVVGIITETARTTPANTLARLDGTRIFDAPLVGFARGDDPVFERFKAVVAEFHMTPAEAFAAGTGRSVEPARVTVVSWVLPITSRTRASHRDNTRYPSVRWANTRAYGDAVHVAVRDRLVEAIIAAGYRALVPATLPEFKTQDLPSGPAPSWSERHVAFAAGLGTFGLSDGLITARGIAHRLGSIVTDMPLQPTPRPYETHTAYCLHLSGYECGKCIERCPAGAIDEKGHDKYACRGYVYGTLKPYGDRIGAMPCGCGMCQAGVPCEFRIPARPS